MPELDAHVGESLWDALKDPNLGALADAAPDARAFLSGFLELPEGISESSALTAVLDARYSGYLEKEKRLAYRLEKSDRVRILADFDYESVPGLSKESKEKLSATRPLTLGQASRVPGVRRSDSALLYIVLARKPSAGKPA